MNTTLSKSEDQSEVKFCLDCLVIESVSKAALGLTLDSDAEVLTMTVLGPGADRAVVQPL
ncbi:hypothetical protein E4U57_007361 [Claviceps arundinis]|uniref:Uncharacterized protein n=1 Tax=Claviceps arundinis TaxID=1623583 RepID=A0ABQ7PJ65_9HYPO|nr:hypothetical protein E4U57_007361 [Claviceps arundinis]